ncbi:hypothetical protein GCM10022254_47490 [Actinomadura meridiana]|uniref:Secreted protein n=1 Tax=Actinomadura meridiana TaxID=559626 RepID=A0ABP8CB16_9ACTN
MRGKLRPLPLLVGTLLATGSLTVAAASAPAAEDAARPSAEAAQPQVVKGPSANHSTATCPGGTKVANGGYSVSSFAQGGDGAIHDYVKANNPVSDGTGWEAVMLDPASKVEAFAICVPSDQAPQVVKGAGGNRSTATCPAGALAASGGYSASSFAQAGDGAIHDYVKANNPASDGGGWEVAMLSPDSKVEAFALCGTPPAM